MRQIVLAGLAAALAGCAGKWTPPPPPAPTTPYTLTAAQTAAVEEAVRYRMKDPASTQFRNVKAVRRDTGEIAVCGEANAKNSFGGYGGFSPFYGTLSGETFAGVSIGYDAGSSATIAKSCALLGVSR